MNEQLHLRSGEMKAIKAVLAAGSAYGYGNMIAHLKAQWARELMRDLKLSEESAIQAANTSAYPLDWKFQ